VIALQCNHERLLEGVVRVQFMCYSLSSKLEGEGFMQMYAFSSLRQVCLWQVWTCFWVLLDMFQASGLWGSLMLDGTA
jgi:hypothetical protein